MMINMISINKNMYHICFDCKTHLCNECLKTRKHNYDYIINIIQILPDNKVK